MRVNLQVPMQRGGEQNVPNVPRPAAIPPVVAAPPMVQNPLELDPP
eukprot:CAMPEP_0196578144 /NCGR_PEP_ID=MMETSP1081-20130531/7103_1 /TAXON_ID=36882 /ORGANISM="Pyramimonas amylifera, Strain CCMP720" /LENGTH=45 /DNA_ID= /DNA_START= /DNA_END= /DNA_ORIENTATION=